LIVLRLRTPVVNTLQRENVGDTEVIMT
jgi:hypothetical protein